MSDYEVIWSGRGSLPGMSGTGWEQRHAPDITRMSLDRGELLGDADMRRAKVEPGVDWVGQTVNPRTPTVHDARFLCACGRKKRREAAACVLCRRKATRVIPDGAVVCGCGAAIWPSEVKRRYTRCKACRMPRTCVTCQVRPALATLRRCRPCESAARRQQRERAA